MCHWPSVNVGHYLKDWETLGICNRQQSLSSITHRFNQLRSAGQKSSFDMSMIAYNELMLGFWSHKKSPSPVSQILLVSPTEDVDNLTRVRGTTQIKKLRCGIKSLHSCSQDKSCEANLLQSYGFSLDTLGSSNLGAALLVARAALAGVSSVVSLTLHGDKFSFIKLSLM